MQYLHIVYAFACASVAATATSINPDPKTTTSTTTMTLTTSVVFGGALAQLRGEVFDAGENARDNPKHVSTVSGAISTSDGASDSPEQPVAGNRTFPDVAKCCQIKRTSSLVKDEIVIGDYVTLTRGCTSIPKPVVETEVPGASEKAKNAGSGKASSSTDGAREVGLSVAVLGIVAAHLI